MENFVKVEEISNKISKEEYNSFLERQKKKGYNNDATIDKDGNVIDVNEQIFAGIKILEDNKVEL